MSAGYRNTSTASRSTHDAVGGANSGAGLRRMRVGGDERGINIPCYDVAEASTEAVGSTRCRSSRSIERWAGTPGGPDGFGRPGLPAIRYRGMVRRLRVDGPDPRDRVAGLVGVLDGEDAIRGLGPVQGLVDGTDLRGELRGLRPMEHEVVLAHDGRDSADPLELRRDDRRILPLRREDQVDE